MTLRKLKPKPCSWCRKDYIRWNSTQNTCSVECALAKLKDRQEKGLLRDIRTADKVKRADTRKRKESLKSKADWLRDAQTVFNRFIRIRDAQQGCISCSQCIRDIEGKGGNYDAGHYRSRGSAPELRFNEDNCFKQCKKCNRQLSGNVVEMRKGILKRIGQERLDEVEGHHEAKKYTIDDIKDLKVEYQNKVKQLSANER